MNATSTIASESARQCGCGQSKRTVRWTAAGSLLAALGVCTACCLLPVVLMSLGVAGAWVSTLDALAPYKWVFVGLTVLLLGYGFYAYAAYWKPRRTCAAGAACEVWRTGRSVRVGLWIATILAITGIVLEPYLA